MLKRLITDNINYAKTGTVSDLVKLNEQQSFAFNDDISNVSKEIIYYRIKVIGMAGEIQYSNVLVIRLRQTKTQLSIMPNPARDNVMITVAAERDGEITIRLIRMWAKPYCRKSKKCSVEIIPYSLPTWISTAQACT